MSNKVNALHSTASRIFVGLLMGLAIFMLAQARPPQAPRPAWKIEPLTSPAGANSSEPQITVQGSRAILSWLEIDTERTTLKFSERIPSGWSAPQAVASNDLFYINSFDVPSVRALADGTLVAHWIEANIEGSGDNPEASNLHLSWSKDKGRTWSKPMTPHHDGTETGHGFASIFQAPGGGFGVLWIDGRAVDPKKMTGDTGLRSSLFDRNGKQFPETVVDSRVCECCSTAVAETSEGLIAAYRDRSANEIRDIYVSRFTAGRWLAPTVVHQDNWRIQACPINGPAVSAKGREVAVAWFVAKDDMGRAFVAFSHDAGRTFGQAVRVDDANSVGRLGVEMLDDGSAAVTWIESTNDGPQFRLRRISPRGERSAAITIAATSGSRYTRIARVGNELLFSWTDGDDGDVSRVRTARASLGQ